MYANNQKSQFADVLILDGKLRPRELIDHPISKAHIGFIISASTLRDQLMKHTPNAIRGEEDTSIKGQHNKEIEVIVIKGVADYGD